MNAALKLLFRNTLRKDKLRLFCAWLGITAAVALLTWAIGLAVVSWNQCRPMSERIGKPFDCWVATNRASGAAPKGTGMQRLSHASPFKMIPTEVVDAVKASDDIESYICTTVFRCRLDWRPEGRPLQGPGVGGGVAPARDFPDGCPYTEGLSAGRWPNPKAEIPEFVISQRAFGEDLEAAPPVGTMVPVVTPTGNVEARICGYLSPEIKTSAGFPTLFASDQLADATTLAETAGGTNIILIKLKEGHSPDKLAETVRTIAPDDDAATLVSREALLKQLRSDALNNLLNQLPLMVALAIVATMCMIINALCIGIEQNRTRYARLRALGMSAWQLARLVVREALFVSSLGGIVGLLVGGATLAGFVLTHPLVFPDGLLISWGTPLIILSILAFSTAIASILPIRRALKCKPFEERAETSIRPLSHTFLKSLGCLLLLLPVLVTPIYFRHTALACSLWFLLFALPCAIFSILHLARYLLPFVERLLAPLLGKLFGLRPELLRGSLSRHWPRNARMVLTLTTGLGAFFAIHIWGASLTDPFMPSLEFPQAIVTLTPNGVSPQMAADLCGVKGRIEGLETLSYRPFSANQYVLHEADYQAIQDRTGHLPVQNNILLIASQGNSCILDNSRPEGVTVGEMFARHTGLNVGDSFRIQRKNLQGKTFETTLTISHVVKCNWHLFSARAGLRGRNGAPMHTLGPVFVPWEVAAKWDPQQHERICFLWLDGLPKTEAAEALYSSSECIETHFRALVEKDPHPYRNEAWKHAPGRRQFATKEMDANTTPKRPPAKPVVPNVTVRLRDEISEGTLAHSAELLGDMARIPLWSLLILSTGFISLLAANVRANAGELRTLHAIGMTRAQMGRFFFAQALILSFTTAILALLLGSTIGWGFTGWTLANMPFGGLPTVFILPIGRLFEGFGVLLLAVFILTPLPILCLVRKLLQR